MERIELFTQLMDALFAFGQTSEINQNLPRTYGTDDVLYMAEVHMLRDIAGNEGITVTELAQMNSKTKSAVSQLVDKLAQKGLIEKKKHPGGNRQVALFLTEKGTVVNNYHTKFDRREYRQVLSKLSDYSDQDFQKILEFINIISSGNKRAIRNKKKNKNSSDPS